MYPVFIYVIDVIDILSQDTFELSINDKLDIALYRSIDIDSLMNLE